LRGAVTLAAALALPLTTRSGAPFPHRDLLIYLSFCVILATLVIQGLSLPLVIRLLKLEDDGTAAKEETKARIYAADAALARLDELASEEWVREDTADRMRRLYAFRQTRFRARFDSEDDGSIEQRSQDYQRLRRELLDAERRAVVQRDFDLEDARLDV
jgi:CPA1 family monovalent cation:H+ antiporter